MLLPSRRMPGQLHWPSPRDRFHPWCCLMSCCPMQTGSSSLPPSGARPGWEEVPIVMLTAKSSEQDIVKGTRGRRQRLRAEAFPAHGIDGASQAPGQARLMKVICAGLLFVVPVTTFSSSEGTEAAARFSQETLSGRYSDWHATEVELLHRGKSGDIVLWQSA
jgi:hypothetical protein